jgi:hypothetical protein
MIRMIFRGYLSISRLCRVILPFDIANRDKFYDNLFTVITLHCSYCCCCYYYYYCYYYFAVFARSKFVIVKRTRLPAHKDIFILI